MDCLGGNVVGFSVWSVLEVSPWYRVECKLVRSIDGSDVTTNFLDSLADA